MIEQGITKIGLVGFCWGGWVVNKLFCHEEMPS
jgi:dienelactone hydrolase